MSRSRRLLLGFVGFAASASATAPALAQEPIVVQGVPPGVPWTTVRYDDLNLANPAGVARLHGRIHRAAESLCVDYRVRDLGRAMAGDRCMAIALYNAQFGVNHAIARHRARYAGYYASR